MHRHTEPPLVQSVNGMFLSENHPLVSTNAELLLIKLGGVDFTDIQFKIKHFSHESNLFLLSD